jgi:hypothetical protein
MDTTSTYKCIVMLGVLVFLNKFSLVKGTVGLKADMSRPVIEPAVGGEHSSKELSKQRVIYI